MSEWKPNPEVKRQWDAKKLKFCVEQKNSGKAIGDGYPIEEFTQRCLIKFREFMSDYDVPNADDTVIFSFEAYPMRENTEE